MNKNIYFNNAKKFLYPILSYLSYWLFITAILFLFHKIIEYNSFIILCDAPIDSTEQFFTDDNNQNNLKNQNEQYIPDFTSPYTHIYCSHFLDKYKHIGKRRIAWLMFEKSRGEYLNYEEYKNSWNPNIKILDEIKKQYRSDINKLKVTKRVLLYFITGSKPGGGRL